MRKLVLFMFLFLPIIVFSAEQGDEKVITLRNKKPRHGVYVATMIKYTQLNQHSATLIGGRVGYIYNKKFSIGAGGYIFLNHIGISRYTSLNIEVPIGIGMAYGGLVLEWIINSRKLFHFSISNLLGSGVITSKSLLWNLIMERDKTEKIFIMEPEVNLIFNVAKHFRIGFSVSYRFISGVDSNWASNKDYSGFSGGLIFKYGWF